MLSEASAPSRMFIKGLFVKMKIANLSHHLHI